jgi:hypothetical protein
MRELANGVGDEEAESIARVTVMLEQVRELTDSARAGNLDGEFPRIGNAMGRMAIARLQSLLKDAIEREEVQLLFDDVEWNSEDRRFFALGAKHFGAKGIRRRFACDDCEYDPANRLRGCSCGGKQLLSVAI